MKIQVITANNGWFVKEVSNYPIYSQKIRQTYFNGSLPEKTFKEGWFRADKDITSVQQKIHQ